VTIYDPSKPLPLNIPEAIAREEGWNVTPPARCRRNSNPGNIEYGSFSIGHGGTATDGRFAIFPDAPTGFAALVALLQTECYAGKSLLNAINNWAPPVENQTDRYLQNVCAWTGLTPDAIIDAHLGLE
jgi:hypothetical protein